MATPGEDLTDEEIATRGATGFYAGDPIFGIGGEDPFGEGTSLEEIGESLTGMGTRERGLERALAMSEFNPYNINTGFGGVGFDGNNAYTYLDPRFQNLSNQLLGGASGFFDQINSFDPMEVTQQQFGLMESILNPIRDRERGDLESRLLSQGRLGSTGGGITQGEFEGNIDRSRQQQLYNALQQGQATQQHLLGMGSGMLTQGIGIERMPLDLIGMGGQLGALQNQANLARARMVMDESNRKADQIGGMFDQGMSAVASFFGGGL